MKTINPLGSKSFWIFSPFISHSIYSDCMKVTTLLNMLQDEKSIIDPYPMYNPSIKFNRHSTDAKDIRHNTWYSYALYVNTKHILLQK